MKRIIFWMLAFIVMSAASVNAQVKIGGDGTTDPVPGAILELDGNGALLLPRVNALSVIATPVKGMLVYLTQTDGANVANKVYVYDGTWTVYAGPIGPVGPKGDKGDPGTAATATPKSDTTPKVAGTAAVGTETAYAAGDHVHPAQTTITGNAATATRLVNGRTIGVSGDATGTSAAFTGAANASIPVTLATVNTVPDKYGAETASKTLTYGGTFSVPTVTVNDKGLATTGASYTMTMPAAPTTITGNAATATRLATGRTFSVSGDATGTSAAFTGAAAATIPVTLATVNAAPAKYGAETASKTLTYGGTFSVPTVTVNGKGLATTGASYTMTMPAAPTNTATATALASGRTFSVSGDATGTSTAFTGAANATIPVTLATVNSAPAKYGAETASKTLTYGGTFSVPTVTVNGKGLATSGASYTMTMPAAPTTITGNAATATKLAATKTISVASTATAALGGITTTTAASFDGSGNVTIAAYVPEATTSTAGVITTGNQTIAGTKTFGSAPVVPAKSSAITNANGTTAVATEAQVYATASALAASGTYTLPPATATTLGGVKVTDGNGLTNTSGTIAMSDASGSKAGAVTTSNQTFAGVKTFTSAPVVPAKSTAITSNTGTTVLATEAQVYETALNKANKITWTGDISPIMQAGTMSIAACRTACAALTPLSSYDGVRFRLPTAVEGLLYAVLIDSVDFFFTSGVDMATSQGRPIMFSKTADGGIRGDQDTAMPWKCLCWPDDAH
ncbi:MAG: hypothetical protein LBO74_08380 [Candidatus Symbiothrix sp.]|jgi:hypothetical protein|nr:hypothetical protein [Candidatus Symbiothrix sp.]